jgi:plastocyanin
MSKSSPTKEDLMQRVTKLGSLVVAVLALAVMLGACSSNSANRTAGSNAASTITIHNFMFNPSTLTVKIGATVTVHNTDSTDHTVTALDGAFNTGPIPAGKSATFTVSKAGTFPFHCNIHNYMTGTIQVTG